MVFEMRRKIVKKKVVTPIKNSSFLNTKATTIAFISLRTISINLFHLHWQFEKIIPRTADTVEQLSPDAVINDLKETPITTGVGDLAKNGLSKGVVLV